MAKSTTLEAAIAHAAKNRHWRVFLRIWCPVCHRSLLSERETHDYPEARLLVLRCPECAGGDFDDPTYYDENGEGVLYDVAEIGSTEHPRESAAAPPAQKAGG